MFHQTLNLNIVCYQILTLKIENTNIMRILCYLFKPIAFRHWGPELYWENSKLPYFENYLDLLHVSSLLYLILSFKNKRSQPHFFFFNPYLPIILENQVEHFKGEFWIPNENLLSLKKLIPFVSDLQNQFVLSVRNSLRSWASGNRPLMDTKSQTFSSDFFTLFCQTVLPKFLLYLSVLENL